MLVLIAGPSGAGKDTLLDAARLAFANDPRFRFPCRVITRPVETDGEQHARVSEAEFSSLRFALSWQAHGFRYGIPADIEHDLAAGHIVVANVSRTVIAEAAQLFPVRVIEITAPPAIVAGRLAERARESISDIEARLARNVALPSGIPVETVMNDATIAEGAARIIAALTRAAEAVLPAEMDHPASSG